MSDDLPPPPAPPEVPAPSAPPAPPAIVLELPAAPKDLRPSPLGVDRAAVVGALDELGDRAREGATALVATGAVVAGRATETVGDATAEALAHVRREGAWRTVFRVVGVVGTLALCLRLAFDDALPRLVLGLGGAALGALAAASAAHAFAVARRRRSLLDALDLLTRVGNARPEALAALAPQIAQLVDALRAEDPRWTALRDDDAILRALSTPGNTRGPAGRSD